MSKMGPADPYADLPPVLATWFAREGRDLPWRAPGLRSGAQVRARRGAAHDLAWGVLVSEIMLQQTPVDRVLPIWTTWMQRWPRASALAADSPGDVIRAWGRLGYPRRALRLHATAVVIADVHADRVPRDRDALLALPGIGDYTAGAVRAFAYGEPALTLDTNVRRVLSRVLDGRDRPSASVTVAEREQAELTMPAERGAHWMAALMELGARVCTARQPRCDICPLQSQCRWWAAGRPEMPAARRQPTYEGSDRQARGALLQVLRTASGPVSTARLDTAWPDPLQRARALDGLVADGLVAPASRGRWRLP